MCRGKPSSRSATRNSRSSCRHRQVDAPELGQPLEPRPQVPCRDVRERRRHDAHLGLREAERLADLADRGARPVGVDHRDAGRALLPVPRQDHVVDVLAARRLDVDVDVRQFVAHRVQEPLEREIVPQRVHVGDADEVADQRAGGAAAARGHDPHRLHVGHDVGDGQEVRRVPHLPDHRELEVQPFPQRLGLGEAAVVDAAPAPLGQQRVRRAARRRREVREVQPPEAEVERAPLRHVERGVAEIWTLGEQRTHRGRRLQVPLGVPPGHVAGSDRDDPAHALERVGQERVFGHEVADRVRGERRHLQPLGEPEHRADLGVGARLQPVLGRDHASRRTEGVAERRRERRGGVHPSAHREPARMRARPEHHGHAGRVRADLRHRDAGIAALAEQLRVGDQPAEVRVAAVVLGQQHDVRVALAGRRSGARTVSDAPRIGRTPAAAHARTNRAAP